MNTMERARRLALLLSSCVLLLSFVASATELDPGVLDVVSATEAVNAEIGIPSLTDMQVTSLIELQSHVAAETGVAAGSTVSSHHYHYRHHSNRHHHRHERRERDREERDQDSSSKFRFRGRESDLNKQRQSRSARERPVAMQQPSHKIEFSEAEPPSPEPLALAETHATVSSEDEVGVKGAEFGMCKTCVFVLERIKKGTNMLLPAICSEIFISFPKAYAMCHQVLNSISLNGNNVRYWLFEGCYKYEIYQAKEWVKPCPTHVMCTVLKNLSNKPFCKPLPMEDPFKDDTME